jgi:zinc protease
VVREQSGLAYYAYSSLNSGLGPGSWDISAGVNPGNVEKAIDLIRKELATFVEKGISPEELLDSQANYIGRLPLSLESNSGVANAMLNMERYGLGLEYYQNYEQMVRKVTPEEAHEVICQYLHPERLVIATAGP